MSGDLHESLRDAGGTVVPFRRRNAPPRRRRRSLWVRLLRPLATAAGLVILPLAAAAWVGHSQRFALAEITVAAASPVGNGAGRVSEAWVQNALAPLRGTNLIRLSLVDAGHRLAGHPWIETAELSKELPSRLKVRVVERRPAAFLRRGDRLYWADAHGRAIAPLEAGEKHPRLLIVRLVEPVPHGVERALAVRKEFVAAARVWAEGLEEVEVLGEEDFRLHTRALPFPVLVRSGDVVDKVRRLEELLPRLNERYDALSVVDLRFSERIVVQPAVATPLSSSVRTSG